MIMYEQFEQKLYSPLFKQKNHEIYFITKNYIKMDKFMYVKKFHKQLKSILEARQPGTQKISILSRHKPLRGEFKIRILAK